MTRGASWPTRAAGAGSAAVIAGAGNSGARVVSWASVPRPRIVSLLVAALLLAAAPASAAPLQGADREAYAAATAAIAAATSRAHRKNWRIDVPAGATAVPARYSVVLVANYVNYAPSAAVMTVERDGQRAVAEWITDDEIFRGELPVAALDEWLRTSQHLQRATQTWKGRGIGLNGFSHASHVPYRSIAVRSLDPATPLGLEIAAAQPIYRDIRDSGEVADFAHTWSVRALERMIHVHLDAKAKVPVDEALRREVLARFIKMSAGTGDASASRAERATTEALLYAALLDKWRYRPALAALRAGGFPELAQHLDVVTMLPAQRGAALAEMLCGDYGLRKLALPVVRDLAARPGSRRSAPDGPDPGKEAEVALFTALRCDLDEYAAAELIDVVERLPGSASVSDGLRGLVGRHPSERVRQAVDRALLLREHDAAARTRLTAAADLLLAGDQKMPESQRFALTALYSEALADPPRRAALLPVIRRVLASIPASAHETYSGMDMLARYLGELGGPGDLPQLHALLATQSGSVVVTIIDAIAGHDVGAAVGAARREVARYARGAEGASFGWNVGSYHALLLRADARAALPELRAALARARRDRHITSLERDGQQALVRYLSARSEAERVRQLLAYVAATGELGPELAAVLRARHTTGLDDAAMQRSIAANTAAWARIDTPW